MKKSLLLCFLLCYMLLSSCGALINDNTMKVESGMTKEQVIKLLGTPMERKFNRDVETLVFFQYNHRIKKDQYFIVDFKNGLVTNMDTYTERSTSVLPPVHQPVYPTPPATDIYPPVPVFPYANVMPNDVLNTLLHHIREASFDSERLPLLQTGVRGYQLTVEQCVNLLKLFDWDDTRMKALEAMQPALADRTNILSIVRTFDSALKQDEATRFLLHTGNPAYTSISPYANIISEQDFNELYLQVKATSFDTERIRLFKVGTQGYRFLASQCASLLSTFDWDNKRMEALRVILPQIADRINGASIVATFSSTFKKDDAARLLGIRRQ